MILPNFLIIGAAKSGTTAIYHFLKQHPDIYMSPVKETNFFALEGSKLNFNGPGDRDNICAFSITQIEDYVKLFEGAEGKRAIGEASPMYLFDKSSADRIKSHIPNVRIIAILRHPVERAFSQYLMFVRDAREPYTRDFRRALLEEDKRKQLNWEWAWQYKQVGFYAEQLKRYLSLFDISQIRIYLYEDLLSNPVKLLQDIFEFVGVNSELIPDIKARHNESVLTRNTALEAFLSNPSITSKILKPILPKRVRKTLVSIGKKINVTRPKLNPKIRSELIAIYREDILELQNLIGRDLSAWLT